MKYRNIFLMLGIVAGLGAPMGAIVTRVFLIQHLYWVFWLHHEWLSYHYFYSYMTIGSACAFACFGFMLGCRTDRLNSEREETASTFNTLNLLAVTDGLTGLYNHRYLHERIALEIEAANRYRKPLVGLMLDLDNFKKLNDQYGHPFGDLVLVTVAQILRENLRRIETAGRYGGEEFMVLMPHTTIAEAAPVAERIRKAIESYSFAIKDEKIRVTASIGMALYPTPMSKIRDKSTFMKSMDRALYQAKWKGKNRVEECALAQEYLSKSQSEK